MSLYKGVVKWFNDRKGFGFIRGEDGQDIFIHFSVIQSDGYKTLLNEEIVYFELSERDKGPFASEVHRTYMLSTTEKISTELKQIGLDIEQEHALLQEKPLPQADTVTEGLA